MQSQPDTQTNTRQREEHSSSDGQWSSSPKVPNLLQFVSNSTYYGRIRIGGKVIRESLKTAVWAYPAGGGTLCSARQLLRSNAAPESSRVPGYQACSGLAKSAVMDEGRRHTWSPRWLVK
jgi:hypothetical protein